MKTKSIFASVLLFGASIAPSLASTEPKDSLIVHFGNNTKMVIHSKDKSGVVSLNKYDLNKIVKDMGLTLDTANKETFLIINRENGKKYLKDTVLSVTKNKGRVSITFNEPKSDTTKNNKNTTTNGNENSKVEVRDGGVYVKDGKDEVYVGRRGVHVKDGDDNYSIGRDNPLKNESKPKPYKSPRQGFNMSFGLNVYAQNNAGTYKADEYDLKNGSSRYVSLGWTRGTLLSKGQNASLGLDFGVEFSWYNMMFAGNNVAKGSSNGITFPDFMVDNKPYELSKSKLTASYINLSLMPTIKFNSGAITYLSFGGYAGYHIGDHTKTKRASDGQKEKLNGSFSLNDFRYGLGLEVGLKNFPDLFVQYDLNNLYQTNKGPGVSMVSFGIRL
jgi:hypothetical protein